MKLQTLYEILCIFHHYFDLQEEEIYFGRDEIFLVEMKGRYLLDEEVEELERLGVSYDEKTDCWSFMI